MVMYSLAGGVGNVKTAATAGGGTALTATAAAIMLPLGARQMNLIPRNFSTAVVVKWTKIPWLTVVKTTDLLATVALATDQSNAAQDNSTGTTLTYNSFDTIANTNAIYIGSKVPFIGAIIDVQNTNGNNSVLTVKYRKSDNTWADISASDGTASGGKTFAQDGNVTWTQPSDWISTRLVDHVTGIDPRFGHTIATEQQFWTRWEVSAALDSTVSLNSIVAIPIAAYAEIPSGMSWLEMIETSRPGAICGIYALTDAGTANLIVDVATDYRGNF